MEEKGISTAVIMAIVVTVVVVGVAAVVLLKPGTGVGSLPLYGGAAEVETVAGVGTGDNFANEIVGQDKGISVPSDVQNKVCAATGSVSEISNYYNTEMTNAGWNNRYNQTSSDNFGAIIMTRNVLYFEKGDRAATVCAVSYTYQGETNTYFGLMEGPSTTFEEWMSNVGYELEVTTSTTTSPTTTTTTPTTTTSPTTTTTSTTSTTTSHITPPPGPDTSKFNFETAGDIMGWTLDSGADIAFAQTFDESARGDGSLQCTLSGCGAGSGSGSQFMMRVRPDAAGIGLPYMNDLTDKTISVWVKFPAAAREGPGNATIQAKMVLFWTDSDAGAWNWLDTGEPPYYLECNGDWEQLTWDLKTVDSADLSKVIAVVIQFAEWGRTTPWNGTFWIDAYDWS